MSTECCDVLLNKGRMGKVESANERAALLREKIADEAAVVFVMDARKEFGAELPYCIRTVEWQTFVHLAATEVAGHALGLKYGFDLRIEVNSGQRC